ncbi:MAG: hypothetical protein HY551_01350 [Elusimicrobia bacterium]|nr:hypothetical protein [Elusimicrobiota bacterium]
MDRSRHGHNLFCDVLPARREDGPLKITDGDISIFTVALRRPFITALGRKSKTRNVAVRIRLRNGMEGYGEASGSVVNSRLKPEALARTLRVQLGRALGKDIREFRLLADEAWSPKGRAPAPAAAAFECALTDAFSKSIGLSLREWFGGAVRNIETDITISASPALDAKEAAAQALEEGFRQFKIKIGTGPNQDAQRIEAVWEAIRTARGAGRGGAASARDALILLDGNQRMTPAQALRLLDRCHRRGIPIALIEQPFPREDLAQMAWFRKRSAVPVAADESVQTPQDALRLLDSEAADVLNVKVAKTGIERSLQIIALAQAARKRLMIGCMQETAAGLSASVHLACGTGAFEFADLDSDRLLAPDQPAGDFRREGPRIRAT